MRSRRVQEHRDGVESALIARWYTRRFKCHYCKQRGSNAVGTWHNEVRTWHTDCLTHDLWWNT